MGGKKDDVATSLTRTRDGKMVMVGYREVARAGDSDFLIMKLDQNGKMRWRKQFGGDYEDMLNGVAPTIDNGIVAIGSTRSYGSSQSDLTVMKIDAKGKTIWHKIYGFKYYEYGNAVATTADGGFMLVGGTNTLGKGNHSLYALALNRRGELIWSHVFGGDRDEYAGGIAGTDDGGMLVVGATESYGDGDKDIYIAKLSKNGKLLNAHTMGGKKDDVATSLTRTRDGKMAQVLADCMYLQHYLHLMQHFWKNTKAAITKRSQWIF